MKSTKGMNSLMKKFRRVVAWILTLAMTVTLVPVSNTNAATVTTKYEAEDGKYCEINNSNGINPDTTAASGGKSVTLNPQQWLTYNVTVQTAGTYDIIIRYASGDNNQFSEVPVSIAVGDSTAANYEFKNTVLDNEENGWNTFNNQSVTLNLAEGSNNITIKNEYNAGYQTPFLNIDYIEITETNDEPVVYPEAVGRHEAENAEFNAPAHSDEYGSFSGGKYVADLNGTSIEEAKKATFAVEASAGTYKLTIGYATWMDTSMAFSVNGEAYKELSLQQTGNEGNWYTVGTVSTYIVLSEGKNTISVTGAIIDKQWINLDYIEISEIEEAVGIHEAEEGEFLGLCKKGNDETFSEGQYVEGFAGNSIDTAGKVLFKVNAAVAGGYKLTLRYGAENNAQMAVSVNDNEYRKTTLEATGVAPDAWKTLGEKSIDIVLAEGLNTITITGAIKDGSWYTFDCIELTSYKSVLRWQTNENLTAAMGEGSRYAEEGTKVDGSFRFDPTVINWTSGSQGQSCILKVNGITSADRTSTTNSAMGANISYSELIAGMNIITVEQTDHDDNVYLYTMYIDVLEKPLDVRVNNYGNKTGKYIFGFIPVADAKSYNVYVDDWAEPIANILSPAAYVTNTQMTNAGLTYGEHTFYLTAVKSDETETTKSKGVKVTTEATPVLEPQYGSYNDIAQIYIQTNDTKIQAGNIVQSQGKLPSIITVAGKDGDTKHDVYDGTTKATMKVRGNSTATADKKAFNISFSSKQDLFELGKQYGGNGKGAKK